MCSQMRGQLVLFMFRRHHKLICCGVATSICEPKISCRGGVWNAAYASLNNSGVQRHPHLSAPHEVCSPSKQNRCMCNPAKPNSHNGNPCKSETREPVIANYLLVCEAMSTARPQRAPLGRLPLSPKILVAALLLALPVSQLCAAPRTLQRRDWLKMVKHSHARVKRWPNSCSVFTFDAE
jgi:hypothetical protein